MKSVQIHIFGGCAKKIVLLQLAQLLCTSLVFAQDGMEQQIVALREQSYLVPDLALKAMLKLGNHSDGMTIANRATLEALISGSYLRLAQLPEAMATADSIIASGHSQNNNGILARGFLAKAYVLFAQGNVKDAHESAFEAERLANLSGELPVRVQALISSGQSYAEDGYLAAAQAKLRQAIELSRAIPDQAHFASALLAIAGLYEQMGENERGLKVIDELLVVAKKLPTFARLERARGCEYTLAVKARQPKRALMALLEQAQIQQRLGAKRLIGPTLSNISNIYIQLHNYRKALLYANLAFRDSGSVLSQPIRLIAQSNVGISNIGVGQVAVGTKQVETVLRSLAEAKELESMQSLLTEYAKALDSIGHRAEALSVIYRSYDIEYEIEKQRNEQQKTLIEEKINSEKKSTV